MSSIRVNPYPLPDLLTALEQVQLEQNTATLELSTGSAINKPSDDPAGAAQVVEIAASTAQAASFQRSIGNITGQLSTADSTLNSVTTALQQALSLGIAGANGTESPADQAAIVVQLQGIQSQLISLANTSYQGQFLFSGTSTVQPFTADSASSSGVTYNGNTGVNQVTIGTGYQVQVNVPGSQIFTGAGGNIFQSLQDLITALTTNTNVAAAVTEIGTASSYLSSQRTFYGENLSQTESQQTYLSSETLNLTQQENAVASANPVVVASELAATETDQSAAISAIARLPQQTLFSYLPIR